MHAALVNRNKVKCITVVEFQAYVTNREEQIVDGNCNYDKCTMMRTQLVQLSCEIGFQDVYRFYKALKDSKNYYFRLTQSVNIYIRAESGVSCFCTIFIHTILENPLLQPLLQQLLGTTPNRPDV